MTQNLQHNQRLADAMQGLEESDNEDIEDQVDDDPDDDDYVESPDEESDEMSGDDEEDTGDAQLVGRNGRIWATEPPNQVGVHTPRANLVRERQGHTARARTARNIAETFQLFVTDEILDVVMRETNRKAQRITELANRDRGEHQEQLQWTELTLLELKAYLGLIILGGVFKSNHESSDELWSKYSRPVFRATMTEVRFKEISRFLRFDDYRTRDARHAEDKLTAFRDVWEMFLSKLPQMYKPGFDLTIDEQLVSFHGRCSFRQYMPSKPGKYGLKKFWCCDAATYYPLKGEVYLGKPRDGQRQQNVGANVVKRVSGPWLNTGRNLTMDNFFTDIGLAEELLARNTTIVGTLSKNKAEIPPQMQPSRGREVQSTVFGFDRQLTMCSYVPKRSKAVILLSSMHHDAEVDEEEGNKPHIILHYNSTKSGVDTLDRLVRTYSCKRATRRWPMALFGNLIDTAGVAAFVVWIDRFPDWNQGKSYVRRLFLQELGFQLVNPFITQRIQNPRVWQKGTRLALEWLGYQRPRQPAAGGARAQGRCFICPREDDRKVRKKCSECDRFVCKDHSGNVILCNRCDGDLPDDGEG